MKESERQLTDEFLRGEGQRLAEIIDQRSRGTSIRSWENVWWWEDREASEFGRLAVDYFCDRLEKEGFINTRHVSIPENKPLYRFTLFSRHPRGEDFWPKVLKIDEKGQRELL